MQKTAILILGMQRSGTSATAGVLQHLGVFVGSAFTPPSHENPKGFFEPRAIVDANESILRAIGRPTYDPRQMPRNWASSRAVRPLRHRLRELVEKEYGAAPLWAIKDSRICRLLPLWLPILDEMDVRVAILLVLRSPVEVARSWLARTPEFPADHVDLLWLRHNLEAEFYTRELPRTVLPYAELLKDWRAEIKRVARVLSVDWPISPEIAADKVDAFLSPELRHQRAEENGGCPTPLFEKWLVPTYDAMLDLSNSASAGSLDAITRELDGAGEKYARKIMRDRHGLLTRAKRKIKKILVLPHRER